MGRVSSHAVSRWSRSPGCCGFRYVFWVRRDFVLLFSFFFFERTRPAPSMRPGCLIYLSTIDNTDRESCTSTTPISTKPGSMEAGECGLTRGACFVARSLELVAVAGLLWISWCVLGAAGFRFFSRFFRFFSSNAHGLLQACGRLASFTSLLVPGCVQASIKLCLSVCLSVCLVCLCTVCV